MTSEELELKTQNKFCSAIEVIFKRKKDRNKRKLLKIR